MNLMLKSTSRLSRKACASGNGGDNDGEDSAGGESNGGDSTGGESTGGDREQDNPDVPEAKAAPANKFCILLVDDDTAVRETLAELLDDAGFRALEAGNAEEALTILRQGEVVDVLVTDLTMPGDDGISLIRQARAICSGLPAVLLTGYAEDVTSVTTGAGGNFHVLRKPVESDRLIQQIELLVIKPGS